MEPPEPSPTCGRVTAGKGDTHIVQGTAIKEESPVQIKQEPTEGLEQVWETQWQEFLRMVESSPTAWMPPNPPDPISEEEMKLLQDSVKKMAPAILGPRGRWAAEPSNPGRRDAVNPKEGPEPSLNVKEEVVGEDLGHAETRCRRFRQLSYREAEGPREVCKELWRLCNQWLRPERHSKEQILELVTLEQLLAILPWELQRWVRGRSPETCIQAVVLAEGFLRKWPGPQQRKEEVSTPLGMEQATELGRPSRRQRDGGGQEEPGSNRGSPGSVHQHREGEKHEGVIMPTQAVKGHNAKELRSPKNQEKPLPARMKMEPQDPSATWERVRVVKRDGHIVQVTDVKELLSEKSPVRIKQEPAEGLEPPLKVKEEVVGENPSHVETRCRRFRQLSYREVEGPREICKELWMLCNQWLKPERHSKEQILELVTLEQLLAILPWEMQHWVRERSPETCIQAVVLAEGFLRKWPQQWREEEPRLAGESIISLPKMQVSVETKEKEGNGHVDEIGAESFPGERTEPRNLCEIPFQSLEAGLMPGSPLKPRSHWENPPGKATQPTFLHEDRELGLPNDAFPERILQFVLKNEESDHGRSEQLNSQAPAVAEKVHTCSDCGKNFNQKANLVEHARTHTGEKPYACVDCGKSFSRKSTLVRHKQMHTGEKPYECAVCGRRFSIRCNLTSHERIHTGEMPYRCSDCGQSFRRWVQLVVHRRTHTGETPYRCGQCGKCFTRPSSLRTHEKIHTGEKPYTCTDCGKSFPQKGSLCLHRRLHTGERPYKCPSCEQRFLSGRDLHRHCEKLHAGTNPTSS